MEEAAPAKEDNTRLIAGLCYVPFLFINIIAIAYVLITGKGGRFAKFHALQSLFFYIAYTILVIVLEIPILFMMGNAFTKFGPGSSAQDFFSIWGNMFTIMIPMMLIGLIFLVASIYLAVMAFLGKETRIPVISRFVSSIMKE